MTAQLQVFADKSTSSIRTTDHRGNLPVIKTITGNVAQHPLCDRSHPFTARRHPEDTVLVESSFFRVFLWHQNTTHTVSTLHDCL